ncbi:hypothetical protein C0Q70_02838 [Pomacea canaliculata]|uniref:Uncharacterized protein n=1 Tax=Pomacea canaliculata TaxID=400727 RepID=A0A2T7PR18_POMCA|nr:hypothetical protein C0Q70_02838 [Pomacea canaliculata]
MSQVVVTVKPVCYPLTETTWKGMSADGWVLLRTYFFLHPFALECCKNSFRPLSQPHAAILSSSLLKRSGVSTSFAL